MSWIVERNTGGGWVPIALVPRNKQEAYNIVRVLSRCDTVGLEGEYRVRQTDENDGLAADLGDNRQDSDDAVAPEREQPSGGR